jgi:hypothetical protein
MTREAYRGSSMMRLTGRSWSELPLARVAFVSAATPSFLYEQGEMFGKR